MKTSSKLIGVSHVPVIINLHPEKHNAINDIRNYKNHYHEGPNGLSINRDN